MGQLNSKPRKAEPSTEFLTHTFRPAPVLQTQAKRLTSVVEAAEAREAAGTLEDPDSPSCEQAVIQLSKAFMALMSTPGYSDTAAQSTDGQSQSQSDVEPPDLTQLVTHFSGLEAHNFELFSACNAANEAIGAMQKELRALQVCLITVAFAGVIMGAGFGGTTTYGVLQYSDVVRCWLATLKACRCALWQYKHNTGRGLS